MSDRAVRIVANWGSLVTIMFVATLGGLALSRWWWSFGLHLVADIMIAGVCVANFAEGLEHGTRHRPSEEWMSR